MANNFLVDEVARPYRGGVGGIAHTGGTGRPIEEQLANARLAAAAPDLLAACQAVMACRILDDPAEGEPIENEREFYALVETAGHKLRAAIAAASPPEGKSE
jgi:hypothetical protein